MSFGESITRPRVCLCRVNKISPIEAVNESKAQVVPKTNQQIAYTSDILQTSVTPAKDTKPRPFQFRQETKHARKSEITSGSVHVELRFQPEPDKNLSKPRHAQYH
jgi:transcriptional regulator NrdR family protein